MERIIINYIGFIEVDKTDLKVQTINPISGSMEDFDTTNLSGQEVVDMLKKGKLYLKSFGETYANDVLDGDDDFSYEFENEYDDDDE